MKGRIIMKKLPSISFVAFVIMVFVIAPMTVKAADLNDLPSGGDVEPRAVSTEVRDSGGTPTNTVQAANVGDQAYWMYYSSGGAQSKSVTFMAIPLFDGSPLTAIIQQFGDLSGSPSTNIITPFGVPYWGGGATSGYWLLYVVNNLGESAYTWFEVTP